MRKTILRALLFVIITGGFTTENFAQQLPLTNQYVLAPGLINPSMISSYKKTEVFGLFRKQWTDIPDAPNTQIVSINGSLKNDKTFIGSTLIHDKLGLWRQVSLYGNFAYRAKISDLINLDFGLSVGGIQQTFEYNRVEVKDLNDPSLSSNSLSKFNFDATFGLNLSIDKFKFGLAAFQLFGNQTKYITPKASITKYTLNRHFNINAQYAFVLSESNEMKLIPIVIGRYVAEANKFNISAPFQYDANLMFDWAKYGWLFVGYKSSYALSAGIGCHINSSFHFGFSYDFPFFTSVQKYIGQTAEISFRYTLKSSSGNAPQFLY